MPNRKHTKAQAAAVAQRAKDSGRTVATQKSVDSHMAMWASFLLYASLAAVGPLPLCTVMDFVDYLREVAEITGQSAKNYVATVILEIRRVDGWTYRSPSCVCFFFC